jgi:hypothetical protein
MTNHKSTIERQTTNWLLPLILRCLAVTPIVVLLLLILTTAGTAGSREDETVTNLVVQSPPRPIAVGETVTTAVRVEDVESLYTFSFRVSFDPTVVEGVGVVPGDFLSPDWPLENTVDNEEGTISYAYSQLNPTEPVTGSGALAIITWRGLAEGTSPIAFARAELYPYGRGTITTTTEGGQIWVTGSQTPPSIASLSPSSALAGSPTFTLTVDGTSFLPETVVHWAGEVRSTEFVSSSRLTAKIGEDDVATAGTFDVRAVNPPDQGGMSAAETFTVTNPAPVITGLSPVTVTAGAPAFTLTVEGDGFVEGSHVQWNGLSRHTTYVSSTRLTAAIGSGDTDQPGTALVSVENPGPGGGTSGELPFEVVEAGAAPYTDFIYLPMVTSNGS